MGKKRICSIALPEEIDEKLTMLSERIRMSRSGYVRQLILKEFEEFEGKGKKQKPSKAIEILKQASGCVYCRSIPDNTNVVFPKERFTCYYLLGIRAFKSPCTKSDWATCPYNLNSSK